MAPAKRATGANAEAKREARIAEANAELAPKVKDDPPVYDERGNVRPRGTPGARPMTYAERVKIAKAIADGKTITTSAERKRNR